MKFRMQTTQCALSYGNVLEAVKKLVDDSFLEIP